MQLSKVTYALVAAGVVGGLATFYQQIDGSPARRLARAARPSQPAGHRAARHPDRRRQPARLHGARRARRPRRRQHQRAQRAQGRRPNPDDDDDEQGDPMREFFKRFGGSPNGPQMRPQPSQGMGSGFIVSNDGYIVTNAHVVDGASEVTVKLTDRREFTAKVVGADKRTDIALIKIDAKDLPALDISSQAGSQARRMGDRHRLAVRLREQRLGRRRERRASRAAERADGAVHPDRRRGQPRQLRRPAAERQGPGRRRQLADLQPLGRLHGPLVRDSRGRRGQGRRPDQDARQGAARTPRRRHPGPRPVARAKLRPHRFERRASSAPSRRADRPRRRASRRATSSARSTARRSSTARTSRAASATPRRAPR